MASKTNICNQALLLLGEDVIGDIDEGTKVADACKVFYDSSKGAVLQEGDWNFAMTRGTFSDTGDSPNDPEWDYKHALPPDCLRVVQIYSLSHDQWHVEGRFLLSNVGTIQGRYIRNDVLEGEFTPMFVKALAAYLASELAYPICEDDGKATRMLQLYGLKVRGAGSMNKLEGSTKRTSEQRLLNVR